MTDLRGLASNLRDRFPLSSEELEFFRKDSSERGLPLRIPPHFLSLIGPDRDDPLRIQAIPRLDELTSRNYELPDPLDEDRFSPLPGLVHRYPDRVLIKMTDHCALNCRHCFRRRETGGGGGVIPTARIARIAEYLKDRREVHEILLSGGDPLTLDDSLIEERCRILREGQPRRLFRICTRIPLVLPERITPEFLSMLQRYGPHWMILQVNHPRELSGEGLSAVGSVIEAGIPVATQTVLLRGVNDNVETLQELFTTLVYHRMKPYYLFQGDLVEGTHHLRVPLRRGLDLVERLRNRLSGIAMPDYAVDLPKGGGKILLLRDNHVAEDAQYRYYRGRDGGVHGYPLEE